MYPFQVYRSIENFDRKITNWKKAQTTTRRVCSRGEEPRTEKEGREGRERERERERKREREREERDLMQDMESEGQKIGHAVRRQREPR